MSEKTIVYEGPEGTETVRTEQLEYESNADYWQFERADGGATEIVRVPRERVYRITQQRAEKTGDTDRDKYGHP
jgi:hypothetical protein